LDANGDGVVDREEWEAYERRGGSLHGAARPIIGASGTDYSMAVRSSPQGRQYDEAEEHLEAEIARLQQRLHYSTSQ